MSSRHGPVRVPDAVAPALAPQVHDAAPARPAHGLLAMQRRYGNRRVARWVALDRVGSPADAAERAADRVARTVAGTAPAGGRHDDLAGPVPPAVTGAIAAARGRGTPLPDDVRARMEGALGADLVDVRVHTGRAADRLSRALGARAFTTGNDVFFRAGEHRPDTAAGHGLLAHELAHVAQRQVEPGGAPIRRVLHPQHLNDSPWVMDEWPTPSGWFDPLDGTPDRKKRAGTMEAIIPPGPVRGSVPDKDRLLGWHWVHQFGGTRANGHWVRFHLLNENLGGRGTSKVNLVPTTQATNKDPEWTTYFDEEAKAVHDDGEPLHFIADVRFFAQVAHPTAPGQRYLHFFPREIEAEYRVWRNGWVLLARALLAHIPRPPTDPTNVPILLSTATDDALQVAYPTLDAKFTEILAGLRQSFRWMQPGTTLQRVYDMVNGSAVSTMSRTRAHRSSDQQKTFDGDAGWWLTLERLLRTPVAGRPLVVNDDVDLRGGAPATTHTDHADATYAISTAARAKKLQDQRDAERKAEDARRRASAKGFEDLFKAIPDDMVLSTAKR